MLCVVVKGPTYEDAKRQIQEAVLHADILEFRLDNFSSLEGVAALRKACCLPVIFTLRDRQQGGSYPYSEEKRRADIRSLASLHPDYFDLEYHLPPAFIQEIFSCRPRIKLILSSHHFEAVPKDLDALYQGMNKIPAAYYKIAVQSSHTLETLKLLTWTNGKKLITIGMGAAGESSRILGPIAGVPITYAALETSEHGQLLAKELVEKYHHRSLTSSTKVYGLIGDPVSQSPSDITHNGLFQAMGKDAIYVKIPITESHLPAFLTLAKQFPFHGLSVTMPLKEKIIPFLDEVDSEAKAIGAVNTLVMKSGKIKGFNTDGKGALNALETKGSVRGKKLVILGAGGAARAIAYEALQRGGLVTIINRDEEKAGRLALHFNCSGGGLQQFPSIVKEGYDILINTAPYTWPELTERMLPHTTVMDVMINPKDAAFLKTASKKACQVIPGKQMFIEQALGQFALWFLDEMDIGSWRHYLENTL